MNYGPTTAIARRPIATAVMHDAAAADIRKLASNVRDDLPAMHVHRHLGDAAEQLRHRNKEGALRHLHAGMHALAPQSLMRHGIITDDEVTKAKAHMDAINRQALRIRDVMDLESRNQRLHDARQAMNAPAHIGSGGPSGTDPSRAYVGNIHHLDAKPWAKAVTQSAGGSLVGMTNADYIPLTMAGPAPYHQDADETLQCPACHKYNDTDARFCDQCGHKFTPAEYNMSAETARLAVTPSPRGKPGGPGLYRVKGLGHSDYLQNIVKALIRGGMDPNRAYAVARGSIRKWARGGGNVHPEVRAAAAAAEAQELKAQAIAHSHSNWDQVCNAIELAGTAWQQQTRVPKGQPGGGQFGSKGKPGSQGQQPGSKAHVQAKIAHMTPQQKHHLKAQLLQRAKDDRAKAHQLALQLQALLQGSRHKSGGVKSSTSPAAAAKAAAAAASAKAKTSTTAKGAVSAKAASRHAQRLQLIASLRNQIHQLLAAANAATQQAAKL